MVGFHSQNFVLKWSKHEKLMTLIQIYRHKKKKKKTSVVFFEQNANLVQIWIFKIYRQTGQLHAGISRHLFTTMSFPKQYQLHLFKSLYVLLLGGSDISRENILETEERRQTGFSSRTSWHGKNWSFLTTCTILFYSNFIFSHFITPTSLFVEYRYFSKAFLPGVCC